MDVFHSCPCSVEVLNVLYSLVFWQPQHLTIHSLTPPAKPHLPPSNMQTAMLSPCETEIDVEVRLIDQQQINEFGRINSRKHELNSDVKELRKALETLEDAEESVMLADDSPGSIRVVLGDSFIVSTGEDATELVAAHKEKMSKKLSAYEAELSAIQARQEELKKVLYGRFGKTINLEDK